MYNLFDNKNIFSQSIIILWVSIFNILWVVCVNSIESKHNTFSFKKKQNKKCIDNESQNVSLLRNDQNYVTQIWFQYHISCMSLLKIDKSMKSNFQLIISVCIALNQILKINDFYSKVFILKQKLDQCHE